MWRRGRGMVPNRVYCVCWCRGLVSSRTTGGLVKKQPVGRRERRQLERAKKKAKENITGKGPASIVKEEAARVTSTTKSSWLSTKTALTQWIPDPRTPGGGRRFFQREHAMHLAGRIPLCLVAIYLFSSDDICPYTMDVAQGPSMLPTIHPIGDLYVRETGAWWRLMGWKVKYGVGDVIVFKDPDGHYGCKRIVGLEGDSVLRYGQFVSRYLDRPDWGIPRSLQPEDTQDDDGQKLGENAAGAGHNQDCTVTIPANHVWLEGDFPPFSRDSRQYGPIPVDWIRGRIVMRVWPLGKRKAGWNRQRPTPMDVGEVLRGDYNLHTMPNPNRDNTG